jgi:hypothetical protein
MTLKLAIAQLNFVVGDMPATRKRSSTPRATAYQGRAPG